MIDLHLHTTASDGRLSPQELVRRAAGAGIHVLAVTDHDSMAGVDAALRAGATLDVTVVPGIEITAVLDQRDVHVLGYYLEASDERLNRLLRAQRQERIDRAREMAHRLDRAGAPIDIEALLDAAASRGGSVARPQLAAALVDAGHATDVSDAFSRWLNEDAPAFVPHQGPTPVEVVSVIAECGGAASFAHPGTTKRDDLVGDLVDAGLVAIEAYHSAHNSAEQSRYATLARSHGLEVTGGSDFHGDGLRRAEFFGVVGLPLDDFERFRSRALAGRR